MTEWIRPCDSGTCVEWREVDGHVEVRDSESPGVVLTVSLASWAAFVTALVDSAEAYE
jgi:hypothetical protein